MGKKKSDLNRDRILGCAFSLFREKGYYATTTREITREADIIHGLLHYYFKKKEEILFQLYTDFIDEVFGFIMGELQELEDPLLITAVFNRMYYRIVFSKPHLTNMYLELVQNRALVKTKILKTVQWIEELSSRMGVAYDHQELVRMTAAIIGSEVEILALKYDGELIIEAEEFIEFLIRMHGFLNGVDAARMQTIIHDSARISGAFSLGAFEQRFRQNVSWYPEGPS